ICFYYDLNHVLEAIINSFQSFSLPLIKKGTLFKNYSILKEINMIQNLKWLITYNTENLPIKYLVLLV
mgnify:CR=1